MAVTTVADLDSIIQVIVAETQFTARQMTMMPNLIRRLDFPSHKGSPIDRPKLGQLVANNLTEGVDMANPQTVTDTDVSFNPVEVGLQTVLTDRQLERAPAGFQEMVAAEHARAYAEKLETDILGLFSGFSNGLSSTNNALTVGNLGAGHAQILGQTEPGPTPHFIVLHPYAAWDIHAALMPLVRAGGTTPDVGAPIGPNVKGNEFLAGGPIGSIFGIPVHENGLIAVDASDDGYGIIASKEAMVLFVTDPGSMRPQRDESLRATELNYVGEYVAGEWINSYGYFFLTDLSAPTA